ncbi:hypothetical protein EBT25_07260 [bacterium]|jgi:hypothetical protein|nr:hypothetical protein [bacterium]
MAIKANITIDQGTDYSTSINLTDEDGNAISLSGYTGSAQLRKTYSSSNAVSFTVTFNTTDGIVYLALTDAQTANITAGRYVYDCFLTDGSGVVSRIVEGIVTVTPRVTR